MSVVALLSSVVLFRGSSSGYRKPSVVVLTLLRSAGSVVWLLADTLSVLFLAAGFGLLFWSSLACLSQCGIVYYRSICLLVSCCVLLLRLSACVCSYRFGCCFLRGCL